MTKGQSGIFKRSNDFSFHRTRYFAPKCKWLCFEQVCTVSIAFEIPSRAFLQIIIICHQYVNALTCVSPNVIKSRKRLSRSKFHDTSFD